MEANKFIENFANQFFDTEPSEITAETQFKDIDEYSSLVALSIIAMVDEEYNVSLKADDIRNSNSIEDLFEIVKSRIKV